MFKEQKDLIHKIALFTDAIIVGFAFLAAYILRDYLDLSFLHKIRSFSEYLPAMVFVVPLWVTLLKAFGVYDSMRGKKLSLIFWTVFKASLVATLIFSSVAFLMKPDFLSRTFVLMFFAFAVTLLAIEKWVALILLMKARRKGFNYRVIVIVGSGIRAVNFAEIIESHPEWGIKILGFIDEEEMCSMSAVKGRIIGTLNEMEHILDANVVDEVFFIMPRKWLNRLEKYITICEKIGVKATIAVDFFDTAIAKPVVRDIEGWPLLTFDSTPRDFFYLSLKHTLDFIGSILGLLILSPLFLFIAVSIKATSKGPVFFRQTRCGLNGRTFQILKFRTMVVDAEQKLKKLQKYNEMEGPVFKIRNDPRITFVGRILRKSSLDELPQLVNVFKGEMSFVGPRPPLPSEVDRYERWQRRRLSMRPGITCIHEVVARNDQNFINWMMLDLEYIDNWSFKLDFKILTMTIFAVIRGTGY